MKKYIAEFIGTFALVFCGTGAIIINEQTGAIGHIGIAITFGLIVMTMIYTFGNSSGAHFNPAVSFGFWAAKLLDKKDLIRYVISQILGAFLATALLKLLFPENINLGSTIPAGPVLQSFILEIILTFLLMLVILSTSQGSKELAVMAGLAIGSTVLLEAMFAGPITGASMNPARSISPALLSGNIQTLWIYVTAPVIGAILGVSVWRTQQKS